MFSLNSLSIYPKIIVQPHFESVRRSRTLSKCELLLNFRIGSYTFERRTAEGKKTTMKSFLIITVICLILASCTPTSYVYGSAQTGSTPATATTLPPVPPTPQPVTPTPSSTSGLPNFDHIVLIMLENRDYQSVMGSNKCLC